LAFIEKDDKEIALRESGGKRGESSELTLADRDRVPAFA
jgi:hypothetical protein